MNTLPDISTLGHLGDRHVNLSSSTWHTSTLKVATAERSNHRTWRSTEVKDAYRDHLDFLNGISGDDLARLRVGKPAREPKLWDDVHDSRVRAAA